MRPLYCHIHSVTGSNLEQPEQAQKIIKTWDQRHDMQVYCDSGVDDQVSNFRYHGCLGCSILDTGSADDIARPPFNQMIIHIPFIHSLRFRSLLVLPPPPTTSLRPTRIRLYTNLATPPDFSDLEDDEIKPVQDLTLTHSPSVYQVGEGGAEGRGEGGRREVEEWPLKVQKMASVWSVSLLIVSSVPSNIYKTRSEYSQRLDGLSTQTDSEGGDKSRLFYLGFKVSG